MREGSMEEKTLSIAREVERKHVTGLSRTQWWRLERQGKAPKRILLGENSVGWLRGELDEWIRMRAAERVR
jgi:prophage regulatory protein